MRQIKKLIKGVFLKNSLSNYVDFGYELIDQADMSFATSPSQENPSILGNKSITLPLGEIKIARKIKSLDIIIKTCTSVNLVTQSKSRIFEAKKSEYTFRTINSLIKSLLYAQRKMSSIKFNITVMTLDRQLMILKKLKKY